MFEPEIFPSARRCPKDLLQTADSHVNHEGLRFWRFSFRAYKKNKNDCLIETHPPLFLKWLRRHLWRATNRRCQIGSLVVFWKEPTAAGRTWSESGTQCWLVAKTFPPYHFANVSHLPKILLCGPMRQNAGSETPRISTMHFLPSIKRKLLVRSASIYHSSWHFKGKKSALKDFKNANSRLGKLASNGKKIGANQPQLVHRVHYCLLCCSPR